MVMKKLTFLLPLFTVLMFHFPASGQRDNRLHEVGVTSIIGNDSVESHKVEKVFKTNAPSAPNENGLPRFAIVGKDGKFYFGIGAQFLGEAVVDWGDEMPSPVLMVPAAITSASEGNRSSTRFGWQSSSIYMNFVAMPGDNDQVGIFFKANFMGNGNGFNVYHFYAKYRGLTAGYTTGVFTDAAAQPFTIDYEGPNGYPDLTLFTVYWQQSFKNNFSVAIGLDAPSASMTFGNLSSQVNQRIPAMPFYLQYAWNKCNSHVRLSGIVRPLQYRNLQLSKNKTLPGWGIQLSGITNVTDALSVQFNGVYGKGISNYIQDDNGLGLDAVEIAGTGKICTVASMGLTAGLTYALNPKLTLNSVYSHLLNSFHRASAIEGHTYRYGDYVSANLIYAVNKFVSTGIEYDYGHRCAVDGTSLHTNRLQCQLAVTF